MAFSRRVARGESGQAATGKDQERRQEAGDHGAADDQAPGPLDEDQLPVGSQIGQAAAESVDRVERRHGDLPEEPLHADFASKIAAVEDNRARHLIEARQQHRRDA